MTTQDHKLKWVEYLPPAAKSLVADAGSDLPTQQEFHQHPSIPEPESDEAKAQTLCDEWKNWYETSKCDACKQFIEWFNTSVTSMSTDEYKTSLYISFYVHIDQVYIQKNTPDGNNQENNDKIPTDVGGNAAISPVSTLQSTSPYYLTSTRNVELATSLATALCNISDKKVCNLEEITCLNVFYHYGVPSIDFLEVPNLEQSRWNIFQPVKGPKNLLVSFKEDVDIGLQWIAHRPASFDVYDEGESMLDQHQKVLLNAIDCYHKDDKDKSTRTFIELYPVFAAMQLTNKWSEKEWVDNTWKKDDQNTHIPLSPEHPAFAAFWINYERIVRFDTDKYGKGERKTAFESIQYSYLEKLNKLYTLSKTNDPPTAQRMPSDTSASSSSKKSQGHFIRNLGTAVKKHIETAAMVFFLQRFPTLAANLYERIFKQGGSDDERDPKRQRIDDDTNGTYATKSKSIYSDLITAAMKRSPEENNKLFWDHVAFLTDEICILELAKQVNSDKKKLMYSHKTKKGKLDAFIGYLGLVKCLAVLQVLSKEKKELRQANESNDSS